MFDYNLTNSNTAKGWAHHYLVHLMLHCGTRSDNGDPNQDKAADLFFSEAEKARMYWHQQNRYKMVREKMDERNINRADAEALVPAYPAYDNYYASDNQCVMMSNHWFYKRGHDGCVVLDGEAFSFDPDVIKYLIARD